MDIEYREFLRKADDYSYILEMLAKILAGLPTRRPF